MTTTASEERVTAEPRPALQDPRRGGRAWQEQVAMALKAREMGTQLRRDKPKSFREIVGQA